MGEEGGGWGGGWVGGGGIGYRHNFPDLETFWMHLQSFDVKFHFPSTNIPDDRRTVNTIVVSPLGNLAAVVDCFGRVLLLDSQELVIRRMWKGTTCNNTVIEASVQQRPPWALSSDSTMTLIS